MPTVIWIHVGDSFLKMTITYCKHILLKGLFLFITLFLINEELENEPKPVLVSAYPATKICQKLTCTETEVAEYKKWYVAWQGWIWKILDLYTIDKSILALTLVWGLGDLKLGIKQQNVCAATTIKQVPDLIFCNLLTIFLCIFW